MAAATLTASAITTSSVECWIGRRSRLDGPGPTAICAAFAVVVVSLLLVLVALPNESG